jgi:uncharacterized protein (TIGR02246 family)
LSCESQHQEEGAMPKAPLLLSVTSMLLVGCQAAPNAANDSGQSNKAAIVDTAADEHAIRGQVARWQELVRARDAAGIAQMYTEDGAVMPPNAPIGRGRAAIEQTWASMMRTPGFELTITPEQIVVSASRDMALDRGTYQLTVAPSGTPQRDTGKYVVVWRHVGGTWRAVADIFNSDLPAGPS